MKLTFIKKSTGKISEKNVLIPSTGKPVQKDKDLLFFYDLDDKDTTGSYKLKSCKISKIKKNNTDILILNLVR